MRTYPERKVNLLKKFLDAFTTYDQVIIINLNNISTDQITKTRVALRKEKGTVLVGKNSIVHIAIKILTQQDDPKWENYHHQQKYGKKPELLNLLPHVVGKIGYVFSHKSFSELKPIVEKEVVRVPARAGVVAQCDVIIEPQQTAIDPGKITEFTRVGIQVKTNKSALEIVKEFKLCSKGEIVSETVSAMCRLLNIIPFEYALKMKLIYIKGNIIPEEFINFDNNKVFGLLQSNARLVTAVSLEAGLPNALSIPHIILNTFKTVLAVGLEGNYKFKELEGALSNQSSAKAPAKEEKKVEKKEEKKKEAELPKEEEPADVDLGDMFG